MAEEREGVELVDEGVAEEREGTESDAFGCAQMFELIERYVTALESGAVEYGGGFDLDRWDPEWMPIWWEGNPKPDSATSFSGAFAYDCHGEKLYLGEDFAVDPPGYYPCYYEGYSEPPIRYRAFAFRNAAEPGEPAKIRVVTFGKVMVDDYGGCALAHDTCDVWKHELRLDDEDYYKQDAASLEELKSIDFDGWDCSDSTDLLVALSDFSAYFGVPFIPNEEVSGAFDICSSDDYIIDGIIAYGDEQRSGIEKLIDLLDRWIKVRRRALDEHKPIPLTEEPSARERVRWGFAPSIEDYDLCSPEELSKREQEAVSLYVKNPYRAKWVDNDSHLPDEVLWEIDRKLGASSSYGWQPENPDPVVVAKNRPIEARRKIKSGIASLKEALSVIDEGAEGLEDDARVGLRYSLYRALIERGIGGLEEAVEKLDGGE